jgi:hypothetical protein
MTPPEPAFQARSHAMRRAALAEVNRRRVNEAIERGSIGPAPVFICECGNTACSETLSLSVERYEAVRSNFDRFLIVPGHEIPEVDRVIEQGREHYVVVKREPEARDLAKSTDERAE